MLYNGMEVGDATPSAGPALFEKVPIFWASGQTERVFPQFYQALIALRKSSRALREGELVWIGNSDQEHVLTYLRRSPDETDLVAVNLTNAPFTGTLEVTGEAWQEVTLAVAAKEPKAGMPNKQAQL